MVERRILSSRSGHGGHTGKDLRRGQQRFPNPQFLHQRMCGHQQEVQEDPEERALEWMEKYQEPTESKNRGKGWRETHEAGDEI